ncbi:MAG: hypothetical protein K1X75_16995 [Leptospirales bacterium]|nr:hypothetical protein [Leptospirales bacterium]
MNNSHILAVALVFASFCKPSSLPSTDPRSEAVGSFVPYEVNHFVRVIAKSGLNIREHASTTAAVEITIPYPVHFRLLGCSSESTLVDGKSGHWCYANYFLHSRSGHSTEISGWVFDAYIGAPDYPAAHLNPSKFTGGCIGVGCFVCDAKAFDPDGTYWDSAYCDVPAFRGRWSTNVDSIRACMSPDCDEKTSPDMTFSLAGSRLALRCLTPMCEQVHGSAEYFESIQYWEPHGFGRK